MASSAPLEVTVHALKGSLDRQNEILERIANALTVIAAAQPKDLVLNPDRVYG